MARLVWKVLLDVVFLELVRHLELHLLYNVKLALICHPFSLVFILVINSFHWTVSPQIFSFSGLCVSCFRVVNANNSAVNLSNLSFMFSFSVVF